jgi:hypothetical protein
VSEVRFPNESSKRDFLNRCRFGAGLSGLPHRGYFHLLEPVASPEVDEQDEQGNELDADADTYLVRLAEDSASAHLQQERAVNERPLLQDKGRGIPTVLEELPRLSGAGSPSEAAKRYSAGLSAG